MRCSDCGAENPAAAKFCNNCGTGLAATCASCGHLNPRDSRFCSQCGGPLATAAQEPRFASPHAYTPPPLAERILRDRPAMEGEHKQVTVLFTDVAGFTSLASALDPETTYTLMQRCFELMLEEVHHYEGTVTQFLGDGILALFGAPIAHEDHAPRAVRAALGIQHSLRAYQQELQETHGIHFRMRIGLNSGPVVVGTIGTDLNMTYTAIGDTVNLGSRVQGLAEPGTVVISENTQRLAGGYFVTRALGEHAVRGKEQAVGAYEVLQPRRWRSRVQIAADAGLTPLVGRQPELAVLRDRYALAQGAGRGQTVLIRGEAGIGKSRLLHEFRRLVEPGAEPSRQPPRERERTDAEATPHIPASGQRTPAHWIEGRCISFGHDIAYLPIIDLLKAHLGIEEMDAEAEIIAKLESGTRSLGEALPLIQPLLKYLLAVDPGEAAVATMDAQMRKLHLFEALRDLLLATARTQPLAVVIEDLHWIDPLSEEFLGFLAEALEQHPIMLLLTARPGYMPRVGFPPSLTSLDLPHLSEPESAALAQGVLGEEALPAELLELIYRKAEGNPFFVEEITRSLLEVGVLRRVTSRYVLTQPAEEILVPDTIQGVIMARLDRLPEQPKRALQIASVIGREFTARLLERTSEISNHLGEYLRELQAVELISESALYPELAYMFKHALTHDVAYTSLLMARRRVLHRLVGEAVEGLYGDRLAEQYETLAYHYEQSETWEKALEYLQKSGEKALAAFAPQQAVAYFDRAFAAATRVSPSLPSDRMGALHAGRGQSLMLTNDWQGATASFEAMREAARMLGEPIQEGLALYQLGFIFFLAHRFEDALHYAERARALAMATGNQAVLAGSLQTIAVVSATTGELAKSGRVAEEALHAARHGAPPLIAGFTHIAAGWLDYWRGNPTPALEQFAAAVHLGRREQVAQLLLWALWWKGLAHASAGQYDQALQHLQEDLEFAQRLGDTVVRSRILNSLGWVAIALCDWDQAIRHNTESAAAARALGDPEVLRNAELNLADCHLAAGRLDEAQRLLESVQRGSQRRGVWGEEMMKWRYTQHLHASLGELCLARGDTAKALEFAEACLTAAEATGSRGNSVKSRRLRGQVLLMLGKRDEAEAELAEALRLSREIGNPAQLRMTLAALGELRQALGRPEEARAAYQEALCVVEGVAAALADAAMRETLLASPQVAALREAAAL